YTPSAAGTDNITITLSNTSIGSSPYARVVGTGGPSAAQTTASVPAGTAGNTTTITITVRDANGNIRTANNDAALLGVSVTGANKIGRASWRERGGIYKGERRVKGQRTDN